MLEPRVLFEDPHLIVLSKPAGLLSQGESRGDANVVDWLRERLGRPYVGLVHRLDRNTSGLMVVAKRTKAANRLTLALQSGLIIRNYRAWLVGRLPAQRTWEHWLKKDERTNLVRVVRSNEAEAKIARLTVVPIGTGRLQGIELTLAEFNLQTGRSHQIRVQSSFEGLPLLGDTKYGRNNVPQALAVFSRPALHSYYLKFPHPMPQDGSAQILEFTDPLPPDMASINAEAVRSSP